VPFRRTALVLAVVAGLHGLLYIPLVSTNEETDTWSYVATANALLDGSYSTPLKAGFVYVFPQGWFDITGARIPRSAWDELERQAFRPPGYPAYLALFGKEKVFLGDHTAALVGQALLFGLGAYLLMLSVRRWWGEDVALLGGLLYAVDPWSKHYVALVLSETLATTVALAGVYAFSLAWSNGRLVSWASVGALAAATALVRAVFVFAAPLAVVAALLQRGTRRDRLLRAGAAGLAAAVLLVPWLTWTNHVVGRATMSVWGEGYNLLLAASGEGHALTAAEIEAQPQFRARMARVRENLPSTAQLAADPTAHPGYLAAGDEFVRSEAGGVYADRLREEPLQVAWETLYRAWFLWAAHEDWYQPQGLALAALVALDWLVLAFALAGSIVAVSRGGPGRGLVVLLAAYTAILATHHVEARFGMPLRGLYLALAALALVEAFSLLRARRADEERGAEPEGGHRRAAD
jgi:4-amino-4-deoxy-L-arabinose transferase-like glycosyltransferase